MRNADQALEDEALLLIIQQELAKRCKKSKTRGRPGTTAEIILRMMLLKHFRDWSFEDLTREVRANLVYREFTRSAAAKCPMTKPWAGWRVNLAPGWSKRFINGWWRSRWKRRSPPDVSSASTPLSLKPTSTIRRTAVCWEMACEC